MFARRPDWQTQRDENCDNRKVEPVSASGTVVATAGDDICWLTGSRIENVSEAMHFFAAALKPSRFPITNGWPGPEPFALAEPNKCLNKQITDSFFLLLPTRPTLQNCYDIPLKWPLASDLIIPVRVLTMRALPLVAPLKKNKKNNRQHYGSAFFSNNKEKDL